MENFKNLARMYQMQSDEDVKLAAEYLKKKKFGTSIMLSVQASINALTSVCIGLNRFRNPTFSVKGLNEICMGYSDDFKKIKTHCEEMELVHEMNFMNESNKGGSIQPESDIAITFLTKAKEIKRTCESFVSVNQMINK